MIWYNFSFVIKDDYPALTESKEQKLETWTKAENVKSAEERVRRRCKNIWGSVENVELETSLNLEYFGTN